MQFTEINGTVFHYRLAGDVRRRPLIAFVNSLGTDLRIWDDVVASLGDRFALLAYDKRGHGLSGLGRATHTIATHADDLAGLLAFAGATRVIVCGVSMGGQVALALATSRPDIVSRLILCDTAPKIGDDAFWNKRIAAIRAGGLAGIVDGVMERWFSEPFRTPGNAAYAGYRAMFTRQPVDGYIAACESVRDCDLGSAARGIGVPTLCVVGDHDGSTPPPTVRAMADTIPGARFATIAGAGHLPGVEQPAALVALIREFAEAQVESMAHAAY